MFPSTIFQSCWDSFLGLTIAMGMKCLAHARTPHCPRDEIQTRKLAIKSLTLYQLSINNVFILLICEKFIWHSPSVTISLSPQGGAYTRALKNERSLSPLTPPRWGGSGNKWLVHSCNNFSCASEVWAFFHDLFPNSHRSVQPNAAKQKIIRYTLKPRNCYSVILSDFKPNFDENLTDSAPTMINQISPVTRKLNVFCVSNKVYP